MSVLAGDLHVVAHPRFGGGRGAGIGRRLVEEPVAGAGEDDDSPFLAAVRLIARSRATLWSGGTLRSPPPKSQSAGMSSRSRYGVGSKPDGFQDAELRSSSPVLPPFAASCSKRATRLCRRTPGLASAMNETCFDSSAARGAIHPAALAPTKPTRVPSTVEAERTASTAPTASAVTRLKRPCSSGQQRPPIRRRRACRTRRTRSRPRRMTPRGARRRAGAVRRCRAPRPRRDASRVGAGGRACPRAAPRCR